MIMIVRIRVHSSEIDLIVRVMTSASYRGRGTVGVRIRAMGDNFLTSLSISYNITAI